MTEIKEMDMIEIKEMDMIELLEELRAVQVERSNLAAEGIWSSTPTFGERSNRSGSFFYRFFLKDEAGRLLSPTGKADLTIPKHDSYRAQTMHETFSRTKRYFDLEAKERDLSREIEKRRKRISARDKLLAELEALQAARRDIETRIDEIEALLKEEQDV